LKIFKPPPPPYILGKCKIVVVEILAGPIKIYTESKTTKI